MLDKDAGGGSGADVDDVEWPGMDRVFPHSSSHTRYELRFLGTATFPRVDEYATKPLHGDQAQPAQLQRKPF